MPRAPIFAVALFALSACSGSVSYDGSDTSELGNLRAQIMLPLSVPLASINYTVAGAGIAPITGLIPVPAGSAFANLVVPSLVPASGYDLAVTAQGATSLTCSGDSSFATFAGQTVDIVVTLQCAIRTQGMPGGWEFNNCPTIAPLLAFPSEAALGSTLSVSAQASDLDGNALTYSWTSNPAGTFSAPASPQTVFTCQNPGPTVLTVVVDDGKGCTTPAAVTVSCIPRD